MKKLFILFLFLCFTTLAFSQVTSVTATVTDPDAINWANGSAQFTIVNPHGGTITQAGVPLTPAQQSFTVLLDSGGNFSASPVDNHTLQPVGTQWRITLCSNTTAPCQTMANITISGSSMNLTTAIASQLQALRFPAGYTARAYSDVEIYPIPPAGATYWNVSTLLIRVWNGSAWQNSGGGGGGGGTPNAPVNSIQLANAALNGFNSDSGFLINPTSHTFTSTGNMSVNSITNTSHVTIDPMDTQYNGGLAAAIAGTSGFTPTQVIQAALDAGECAIQTASNHVMGALVYLPPKPIPISGLLMWSNEALMGDSQGDMPDLAHNSGTQVMITGHVGGDTLTCGGSTYTPSSGHNEVAFMYVDGYGGGAGDTAIVENSASWYVHDISGGSIPWGRQVIHDTGQQNYSLRLGYTGSQLKGCQDYFFGGATLPPGSYCASVQADGTDGEVDNVYATDGAGFPTGSGPTNCYPGCSAIGIGGGNTKAHRLFAQVSDVNVHIYATGSYVEGIRADLSGFEGIRVDNNFSGTVVTGGAIAAPCTNNSFSAAYAAGTYTGCNSINDNGFSNVFSNIQAGASAFFGSSYIGCQYAANQNGASGAPSVVALNDYFGNPDNQTSNDLGLCNTGAYANSAARFILPEMYPVPSHSARVNINGISAIAIDNGTPITQAAFGFDGQVVRITASYAQYSGTVIPTAWDGVAGHFGIITCSGLPETVTTYNPIEMVVTERVNQLTEICNTPNLDNVHVNWRSNLPAPTNPSVLDVIGNSQTRIVPATAVDLSSFYGPPLGSGQYCFEYEQKYPDGFSNISPLGCTNIDIAGATAGGIIAHPLPTANNVTLNLYLVSKPAGSAVPLGKYPGYTYINVPPLIYGWDHPIIAAGGDGSTPPTAGENDTGMWLAPYGLLLDTFNNAQPPCTATIRGRMWLVSGSGVNPDVYQGCVQTGTSTYQWINLAFGSTGTTGWIPLFTGPTAISNSHINEVANAGYETITQPVIINDPSGNGGYGIATEGTAPTLNSCSTTGALNIDCWWADSTKHQWLMNNNAGGVEPVVGATGTITNGHCAQFSGTNGTLVDAGAACGTGGGVTPGTPTFIADSGAGTSPTITFATGSSDFSGFINITLGTCTGGTCNTTANQGVVDVRNSKFGTGGYSPQLKCFIQAASQITQALTLTQQYYTTLSQQTALKFTIISGTGTTGIAQGTTLVYYYHCDFQ